ncbi:MAG TPA: DUF4230 domain-containing protein [Candidatus Limiplasma sp.]|nr:DUF4230 domain-containing protein [Candidatus Limiplasma sp.]
MNGYPPNPNDEEERRPRRRRHGLRRFFRGLFLLILCLAIAFVAVRFGPNLYRRFFGNGNTTWVSERFGEKLLEKNELIVYETTITGQETVSQTAWLIGKVQEVKVPYSFSISFVVDLSQAAVTVDTVNDTINVRLPSPQAKYQKLTVDEAKMQKNDWLYPLTPERYAQIKSDIETKLYDECATKQEYLDAAWETAVKNMQSLFKNIAAQSTDGVTCTINVIRDDTIGQPTAEPTGASPTATPAAA